MRFEIVFRNFDLLVDGLWLTIQIAVGATILGLLLGLIKAVCRMSPIRPLTWLAGLFIAAMSTEILLPCFSGSQAS